MAPAGKPPRHDERSCSHSGMAPDGSPPRRPPERTLVLPPPPPLVALVSSLPTLPPPRKPRDFARQNLQKTLQNPTSSTLVNRDFFLRSSPPSRACHPTLPAMGNGGGAAQLRGETWTAAVSRPARDQPQRVGSSSRIEYFRRSHSCEAAAAGLRHSRGPGAGPATECGRNPNGSGRFALPTQSGTRTELPDTSSLRGASWRMRCAK